MKLGSGDHASATISLGRGVLLLLLLVVAVSSLLAFPRYGLAQGARGTIRGKVVDKKTGDPLPGVNIVVVGTYYGAASGTDGKYVIPNMRPGTYQLRARMIGYREVEVTGVKVRAGQTVTVNFELEPTVLTLGQEVVVVGEKPLFDIEETASRKRLGSEELSGLIVENVQDVVATQVGVVRADDEIHIRGGRSYENAYLIDGISVQDPLAGTGFGLQLSSEAIQEVEVITGGFNAEYGQAMSGIISIKTKEGGDQYKGLVSYKRDHFGSYSPDLPLVGELSSRNRHSFNTDIVDINLSGPEPLTRFVLPRLGLTVPGKVSFFTNLHTYLSDTYIKHTARQLYSSIFYGTRFAPRQDNRWASLSKLTWRIDPVHKLALSYSLSVDINQNTQSLQTRLEFVPPGPGYPYEFQKNLDEFNTFTHLNERVALMWTHTLSPATFYELKLSRYFTHLRADAHGLHWSQYVEPQDIVTQPIQYFFNSDSSIISVIPGDGFWDYGNAFTWHDHFVDEWTLKLDLTSLRGTQHKFKTGLEMSYADMQLIDIYKPWFGGLGLNNDLYRVFPNYGAFYVQDNITFKGLIANLGVRFDYWFPGKFVEDAVNNPDIVTISEETRRRFKQDTFNFFGRRWKGRLSPRVGISHPVSDNQMLFFSYGHFSKRPKPQFVYAKLGKTSAKSTFQKFGNPNLNPETTVAYELGLRHKFTQNDVLSVTAYYKDIFDYVTTVTFRGRGRLAGRTLITYLNLDYSRARGIEVEYRKRAGRYLSGSISASYSLATGKSSSPEDAALVVQGKLNEKPIKENYLIWDRPWQISAYATFNMPKGKGPRLGFFKLPDDWSLSLNFFGQAGKRYTPYYPTGNVLPDGRPEYDDDLDHNGEPDDPWGKVASPWIWLNANFNKYFKVRGLEFVFTVEVLNLFDRKNSDIINPVTGRAYELGDPTPPSWNDPLYPDRQAPLKPYPFNPARYLNPRNVRVGLSVRF